MAISTDIFLQSVCVVSVCVVFVCVVLVCVVSVSVCVCVCSPLFLRATFSKSRGPGTYDCLSWPTKTRQHRGENVPAHFELLPKLSNLPCLVPSCSCG